jgi:hypothetical protein
MYKILATVVFIAVAGVSASLAQVYTPGGIPLQSTTPPNIANPGLVNGPPDMNAPRPPPLATQTPVPNTGPMLNSTTPPRARAVRGPIRARQVATVRRSAARAQAKSTRRNVDSGIKDICKGC